MTISSLSYDWGVDPTIIRMTTTSNLAAITTAGFWDLPATQAAIESINNGSFDVPAGSTFLVVYSGGEGFFTLDTGTGAFVAETVPGALSETLLNTRIFVGNASNVATGVAMSGDATISNTGVLTISAGAIDLAMLSAGIAPSHVVKFAGQETTVGGAAAEAFTVTGVAATDLAFVQIVDNGTSNVTALQAVCTLNTLTVTFSADPGADTVINYQILRAAV